MATTPPPYVPQIHLYRDWLARERDNLRFDSYDALWRWSTTELDAFWQSIWDYFDLRSPTPHTAVLEKNLIARCALVSGSAVQLRAAGVPPCRCRARGGLCGRDLGQRKGQRRERAGPSCGARSPRSRCTCRTRA